MPIQKAVPATPRQRGGTSKTGRTRTTRRVTFVIDEELDNLLEVFCNASGNQKNDIAQQALAEHLAQRKKALQDALKRTEEAINHLPMPLA